MSFDGLAATWPANRLKEGLAALMTSSGIAADEYCDAQPHGRLDDNEAVENWLLSVVPGDVEIEALDVPYNEVEQLITTGGPFIARVAVDGDDRFLLVLGRGRRSVRLLASDSSVLRATVQDVSSLLSRDLVAKYREHFVGILDTAQVPEHRRKKALNNLQNEILGTSRLSGIWILRFDPGNSFWQQLRRTGQVRALGFIGATHVLQYCLLIASWWLIGRAAFRGQIHSVWLVAWALMLATLVALRVSNAWRQGRFVITVGGLLKQRLLHGLLCLDPERTKTMGAGQLLGRVVESEALQQLLLGGGFLALLASFEVVFTLVVLSFGAGGILHALLYVCWIILALFFALRHYQLSDTCTTTRINLTHDLIERIIGHRTRLAQQIPDQWHLGEDQLLSAYVGAATRLDQLKPRLDAVCFAWPVIAIICLIPFVSSRETSQGAIAIALGGIILGHRALMSFSSGAGQLADAGVAWKRVAPIFTANTGEAEKNHRSSQLPSTSTDTSETILMAHDLSFRYTRHLNSAVERATLNVHRGDRWLLTGSSGGGKSTLASLLAGIRKPDAGLLLLHGLDLDSLGERTWRQLVAYTPQFHENHVLTETFAFNLLMGRDWPPRPGDMEKAERLCRELGLGELLDRMPAGMMQMVGDTGWQLSHGERSRLFVARGLLQNAEVVILDESFGALDPKTSAMAIRCAMRHAETLIVIAHP